MGKILNPNDKIIGKSKKSIKVSGIFAVIFLFIMVGLIFISGLEESDDGIGMLLICLPILGLTIFGLIMVLKMPDDLIVYNKNTKELRVRAGQTFFDRKNVINVNLSDVEDVCFHPGNTSFYIVVTVSKTAYVELKLKNGSSLNVVGCSDGYGVVREIKHLIKEESVE